MDWRDDAAESDSRGSTPSPRLAHRSAAAPDRTPSPAAAAQPATSAIASRSRERDSWPILIGVSTGGPRALIAMLPELCERVSNPILIVQHMPAHFSDAMAHKLNTLCRHRAGVARCGDPIAPSRLYLAPPDRHLVIRRDPRGGLVAGTSDGPPVNGFRPAVDVLFESGASLLGHRQVGLVLTGMGNDGRNGTIALGDSGAAVLAQDQDSSAVWGMPGSAVATGRVRDVVPLAEIPDRVQRLLRGSIG